MSSLLIYPNISHKVLQGEAHEYLIIGDIQTDTQCKLSSRYVVKIGKIKLSMYISTLSWEITLVKPTLSPLGGVTKWDHHCDSVVARANSTEETTIPKVPKTIFTWAFRKTLFSAHMSDK